MISQGSHKKLKSFVALSDPGVGEGLDNDETVEAREVLVMDGALELRTVLELEGE